MPSARTLKETRNATHQSRPARRSRGAHTSAVTWVSDLFPSISGGSTIGVVSSISLSPSIANDAEITHRRLDVQFLENVVGPPTPAESGGTALGIVQVA